MVGFGGAAGGAGILVCVVVLAAEELGLKDAQGDGRPVLWCWRGGLSIGVLAGWGMVGLLRAPLSGIVGTGLSRRGRE